MKQKVLFNLVLGVMLTAVCGAAFAQTAEQNMTAQSKQHIVPGKQLHAVGPNYEFCEVAPIVGTSKENAVANFYNPTGVAHCSPEQFTQIVGDKEKIIKDAGAINVFLNPSRQVDPNFDMKTAVRKQVDAMDIDAYFTRLAQLMKTNPPTAADAPLVARMAKIGLVPGQDYDPSKLGAFDREAVKTVPKLALLKMVKLLKDQKTTNGWLYFTSGVGNWGTDYPLRAMGNMLGPGWNRPQDAVYPLVTEGCERRRLQRLGSQVCDPFREGTVPAGQCVLVDHSVRP